MVEVGGLSFKEGLKIYTSVYLVRNISLLNHSILQFVSMKLPFYHSIQNSAFLESKNVFLYEQ